MSDDQYVRNRISIQLISCLINWICGDEKKRATHQKMCWPDLFSFYMYIYIQVRFPRDRKWPSSRFFLKNHFYYSPLPLRFIHIHSARNESFFAYFRFLSPAHTRVLYVFISNAISSADFIENWNFCSNKCFLINLLLILHQNHP